MIINKDLIITEHYKWLKDLEILSVDILSVKLEIEKKIV